MKSTRSAFTPAFTSAFTMVEMLVVLILLAAFALVSARLFRGTMRVMSDTRSAQDAMLSTEQLSRVLRNDVWGATEIATPDSHALVIKSGAASVKWSFSDREIRRESGGAALHWVGMKATVSTAGPAVVLRSDDARMSFVSQVLLARSGER